MPTVASAYVVKVPVPLEALEENCDVRVCLAERHYYNCDYMGKDVNGTIGFFFLRAI